MNKIIILSKFIDKLSILKGTWTKFELKIYNFFFLFLIKMVNTGISNALEFCLVNKA